MLPALVDHLVGELEPAQAGISLLAAAADTVDIEHTTVHPPMDWDRHTWKRGEIEVVLRMPRGPQSRELSLKLKIGSITFSLTGPSRVGETAFPARGDLVLCRITAIDDAELQRGSAALASFFSCGDVPTVQLPSTPKKWAKLVTRTTVIPRATLPILPDAGLARLAGKPGLRRTLLGADPSGHVVLGQLYTNSATDPVRLSLELAPGAPLPRLRSFYPVWPDVGGAVEPIADLPPSDRSFDGAHGLLRPRHDARGREWFDGAIWIDHLLREVRYSTAADAAGLDPDDARAPWTVEWCETGNINYAPGHPGGSSAMFASFAPTAPGEPRRYEIMFLGATPLQLDRWAELLAAARLRVSV